jgi:hypothetical protein
MCRFSPYASGGKVLLSSLSSASSVQTIGQDRLQEWVSPPSIHLPHKPFMRSYKQTTSGMGLFCLDRCSSVE